VEELDADIVRLDRATEAPSDRRHPTRVTKRAAGE